MSTFYRSGLLHQLRCLGLRFTLALFVGCTTLGPDYSEPTIEWLDAIEQDIYGQTITFSPDSAESLSQWWRQFNDPVLDQLIAEARAQNPSLRIAGLRVLESRALLAAAGATLYPQVQTLDASAFRIEQDRNVGASGFNQWSGGLTVGWELDFWGRFRRGIESADAAFAASVLNQRDAQVLLTAQVVEFYWRYQVLEERIEILTRNAERQKRSYDITRQMFEAGQQSELDLQQARTQYLSTLSSLPALEQAKAQTQNALSALLARPPGDIPGLNAYASELPLAQPLAVADVPAHLIQRRPDVRGGLWAVAAQSAQIGLAEAEFYPSIAVAGNLGWAGNSLSNGSVGTLGVGPVINWTVFDWGRIENSVRVQDARLQQAIEAYRATVVNAAREINDAVIQVERTAEQRLILEETVLASERALSLASTRYREGYADFQRVLDAQRVVFTSADRKLQNDGAHLSALVALYKAIGGGWQADSIDQMLPAETLETMQERSDWGELLRAPFAEPLTPVDNQPEP